VPFVIRIFQPADYRSASPNKPGKLLLR